MAQYISTNVTSLVAQTNLAKSSTALAGNLERLSSGQRINSASDDAAGMAIASRMTSQIVGNEMAKRNTADAISMTQTAEGAMGVQVEQLQRARELAVQSANGMLADSDRQKLENEQHALMEELDKVATETTFNGKELLTTAAAATSVQFQVGANSAEIRKVDLADTTASTLGNEDVNYTAAEVASGEYTDVITGVAATVGDVHHAALNLETMDISTQAGATASIVAIDGALDTVQTERSNMGSYQNRFEQVQSNLDVSISNTSASRGRIQDADFAKETADMTKNQILSQAGVAMLSQANQLPQNVLSLLR